MCVCISKLTRLFRARGIIEFVLIRAPHVCVFDVYEALPGLRQHYVTIRSVSKHSFLVCSLDLGKF